MWDMDVNWVKFCFNLFSSLGIKSSKYTDRLKRKINKASTYLLYGIKSKRCAYGGLCDGEWTSGSGKATKRKDLGVF